jgi:homoserine dehydrogenase
MNRINVGLLGCGTVGTGVAKILTEKSDLLSARTETIINLKYIADLDIDNDRGLTCDRSVFTNDSIKVVEDPDVDIIIETIGGETIAKDLILKAIENGKHVVTANKALIANHGNEIFKKAADKGVSFYYEASVGGCMPVIKTIRESLVANIITSINGILNGTCNYILTRIADEGIEFEKVLKQAQDEGYAEADPSFDIDGIDTAHKIAILASISYGMKINFEDVYVEGIRNITPFDLELADYFGYTIKLLAVSRIVDNEVDIRVHPTMIPKNHILASVKGTLNAVNIKGDETGDVMLYGHGAGMRPTASAIISDVIDISRSISSDSFKISSTAHLNEKKNIKIKPIEDINSRFYFRFSVDDRPGVLSIISGILGEYGISLESVQQKGQNKTGHVPVIMLTHLANEKSARDALNKIDSLDVVKQPTVVIRIEDNFE